MQSFRAEPFLWIHLSGLAMLPLCLELVWLGLAIGDPVLPFWLELLLITAIGSAPIFWMQWNRPFDIFSLLFISIAPDQLNPQQRQILSRFKTPKQRVLTVIAALVLIAGLWPIYRFAPLATPVVPFSPRWHFLGLLLAALAFLASNLFLQVPVSVLGVLLTSEQQFAQTSAYPPEQIKQDFLVPGIRVSRLLPPLEAETVAEASEMKAFSTSAQIAAEAGQVASVTEAPATEAGLEAEPTPETTQAEAESEASPATHAEKAAPAVETEAGAEAEPTPETAQAEAESEAPPTTTVEESSPQQQQSSTTESEEHP